MARAVRRRKVNMIDRNILAYCIFALAVSLSCFLVSAVNGSDGLFYAAGPVAVLVLLLGIFVCGGSAVVAAQIAERIDRDRVTDALLFYKSAQTAHVVTGLILILVAALAGEPISGLIFGSRYDYLTLYTLAPAVLFGMTLGPMKGFLDAAGYPHIPRFAILVFSLVTLISSGFLSHFGRTRGDKIALLLMNERYGAVYTGAGLGLSVSAGALAAFIFLLVFTTHIKHIYEREETGFGLQYDERMEDLIPYYFRKLLPITVAALIPYLVFALDYRIGLVSYGDKDRAGFGLHWWDGYAGVAFPVIAGMTAFVIMFFSKLPSACADNYLQQKNKSLRIRYSMMLRLASYCSIAISAFLFGAAKPIVQIAHLGVNTQARESAILTLKLGSVNVFLLSTAVLLAIFFWKSGYASVVMLSGGLAFVCQLIALLLFMHVLTISMKALPIAMAVFGAAYIIISTRLAANSLLKRTESSWVLDNIFVLAAAAAADVPVMLLNDFVTDEIIPVGGMFLLLLIFVVLFVAFSLFFRAVDLANIDRIPGGKYIYRCAQLFGFAK